MGILQLDPYANFFMKLVNKEIDLDTDTIRVTLHNNTYTPDRTAHDYFNDVTNELATAGGYTVGGIALATKAVTLVAANSWSRAHATATAYNLNEIVRPAAGNGFVYRCSVAGTSAGAAPTWPTVIGQTVTDGGITWTCVGRNVLRFTSDPVVWAAPFSAGPFRHVVMWCDTAGASSTDPLIAVGTYASDQTGADGTFTLTPDSANGWLAIPIP